MCNILYITSQPYIYENRHEFFHAVFVFTT